MCYTYGYYFGLVSVNPSAASTVYIAGVPLLKSTDGGATFASLDQEALQSFLDEEGFPEADSASSVKARVASGELMPRALYDYLTDGNRPLFDTKIVGPDLYRFRVQGRGAPSSEGS